MPAALHGDHAVADEFHQLLGRQAADLLDRDWPIVLDDHVRPARAASDASARP